MKKLICLLFVLMLAGCSANVEEKDGGRLNIAVSVAPGRSLQRVCAETVPMLR